MERGPFGSRGKRGLRSLTEQGSREGSPRFERRLCRRNRCLGGGFGRGAKPPSEFLAGAWRGEQARLVWSETPIQEMGG